MTKKEKDQWLEAIAELREHYENYPLDEIPPSYTKVMRRRCSLCNVAHSLHNLLSGCNDCLWEKYEGRHCSGWYKIGTDYNLHATPYHLHTTQERLDRLDRWEKKVREEELT